MAFPDTQRISRQPDIADFGLKVSEDKAARRRLEILLAENAETSRSRKLYRSDREKFEAELMLSPLNADKAFSYFGLMLGTFPPATIFMRYVAESRVLFSEDAWIVAVLLIVNVVSAVVGFFSGKLIGRIVSGLETLSWSAMILLLPFIGLFWGFMAGGAGGFIIFIVGSIFGAFLGGAVGSVALPLFAVFHRLMKRGDLIEAKHFFPLALGVTLSICSFILGL